MAEALTSWIVLFGQADDGGGGVFGVFGFVIWLALTVLVVAGFWKVLEKAGLPGWGALIPIYNAILWMRLAGRPGWWVLLLLIPFVNFIIGIIVNYDVAQKFGKGVGFAMGLMFLPMIFYPILGFGSARYHPTLARLRQQAALA
jgi:hypothetical protein